MASDLEELLIEIENSFVLFLITISKLDLSSQATLMLIAPQVGELHGFLTRNEYLLKFRRPKGVLIL